MRTTKDHLTTEGWAKVLYLEASMNKARTEFDLPADHQVPITWNWILGFVKGDSLRHGSVWGAGSLRHSSGERDWDRVLFNLLLQKRP
jgi:hypothetical protein